MRTWLALFVVAASISLGAQSPPAQGQAPASPTQPEQGPTFRTGADVITIALPATDSAGKPVRDLRASDFTVRIDGQPRRVVSVEAVTFDADATRRQIAAEPFESFFTTNQSAPNSRLIVLAVDQLNIQPGNVRQLLQS